MDDQKKTWSKALFFLGKRAYGTEELRRKLIERGCDEGVTNVVIERCVAERLLDDQAFISQWLELVAERRGYGYVKIKQMLIKKLFNSVLIDEVYNNKYIQKEYAIALRVATQKKVFFDSGYTVLDDQKQKEKLGRFLVSRGFGKDVIYRIFESLFQ